jgi:hypothetical protein
MGSPSADDEEVATARAGSEVETLFYHLLRQWIFDFNLTLLTSPARPA